MATAVASASRTAMTKLHRASEPDVLKPLIERTRLTPESRGRVMDHALALLSLAEAFLRVPDPETADLPIADKLGDADWKAHAGKSNSALVNSATWGLMLGRAGVGEQGGTLRRLISRPWGLSRRR